VKWEFSVPAAIQIQEIDATLRNWEGRGGIGCGFQSGDLGWMLRHGREETAKMLSVWRSPRGDIGAVAIAEGSDGIWLQISLELLRDGDLAGSIADDIERLGLKSVACASIPAAIRRELGVRLFAIDQDPWLHLWRPLVDEDIQEIPGVVSTATEALIEIRVAVQRAAFERSTFTREKWSQMAEGPSFRSEFDLIALNDEGVGVSAVTVWLPGTGTCGVVEPMGTSREYQRQGHGRRVLLGAFSALRKNGASSVRVTPPQSNEAAVATYLSVGFIAIDADTVMVRP